MDFSMSQAMGFIISTITVFGVIISLGVVLSGNGEGFNKAEIQDSSFFKSEINKPILNKTAPTLVIQNMRYYVGDKITPTTLKKHVKEANDVKDGDLRSKVKVLVKTKSDGTIDTSKIGKIKVQFSVENSVGLKTTLIKNIIIEHKNP